MIGKLICKLLGHDFRRLERVNGEMWQLLLILCGRII